MKRQLSGIEKKFSMKMIKKLQNDLKHLDFLLRFHDLMIGEGLYYNYLAKLDAEKGKKKDIVGEITEAKQRISTLQSQIRDGVEEKVKKKTPDCVG